MTPEVLSELGYKMLKGADYWDTLGSYDKAIACHQAAALYFQACAAVAGMSGQPADIAQPVKTTWQWEDYLVV